MSRQPDENCAISLELLIKSKPCIVRQIANQFWSTCLLKYRYAVSRDSLVKNAQNILQTREKGSLRQQIRGFYFWILRGISQCFVFVMSRRWESSRRACLPLDDLKKKNCEIEYNQFHEKFCLFTFGWFKKNC